MTAPAVFNAGMVLTLMGERFIIDNAIPFGDAKDVDTGAGRGWAVADDTYGEIAARSNGVKQSIIQILRSRRREGSTVVTGVVSERMRPGGVATKPRRANLDDLSTRSKALVRQFAELSDLGPIPEGQMAELTQTYAALQAERDALDDYLSEIDASLSLGRGMIMEYTMQP